MKHLLAKIVRGPLPEFVIVGSVIVDFIKIFRKNAMPKSSKGFLVEQQRNLHHRDLGMILSSCISDLLSWFSFS